MSDDITIEILRDIREELRAMRNLHGGQLQEHSGQLALLGQLAVAQVEALKVMGATLKEHTTLLKEHGAILKEHGERLEGLQLSLHAIRGDLKEEAARRTIHTNARLVSLEDDVEKLKKAVGL